MPLPVTAGVPGVVVDVSKALIETKISRLAVGETDAVVYVARSTLSVPEVRLLKVGFATQDHSCQTTPTVAFTVAAAFNRIRQNPEPAMMTSRPIGAMYHRPEVGGTRWN